MKTRGTTTVLGDLRRRMLQLQAVRGGLMLLGAVLVLALLAIFADAIFILPQPLRVLLPWLLVLAAMIVLVTLGWIITRFSELRLARMFEASNPELGSALTNAVQLREREPQSPLHGHLIDQAVVRGQQQAAPLSTWPVARRAVLAAVTVAGATAAMWLITAVAAPDLLAAVIPRYLDPAGDHPPYSRLKIALDTQHDQVLYGGQCEVVATISGAPAEKLYLVAQDGRGVNETVMFRRPDGSYFQTLVNLREPTRIFVTDGRARSLRHQIDVRYTPRIELVEYHAEFPKYTAMPARQGRLESDTLSVPRRTQVSFRAISNRPLSGGTLQLTPLLGGASQDVALMTDPQNPMVVSGAFQVDQAVAFTLSVRDVDGLTSSDNRKGRLMIQADQRPQILVLEPSRRAVATPSVAIPVKVQAEDDYAVDRIIWFRGFNRSIERPLNMQVALARGPAAVEAAGNFDLSDLGVRPGDVIEYFFEAVDNYPDGPNVATSRVHVLEIISEDQYREILRQMAAQKALFQQYLALENHLRRLVEHAEQLEKQAQEIEAADGGNPQQQRDHAQQTAAMNHALGEYDKVLQQALHEPMFDIEPAFQEQIRKQQDQLRQIAQRFAESIAASGGVAKHSAAGELAEGLQGMLPPLQEQVAKPAQHIVSVVRVLAQADEFVRLTQAQEELLKIARRFSDHEGGLSRVQQMELQELSAAQQRVRDGLRRLSEALPELVDELPADTVYDPLRQQVRDFLNAVEQSDIQGDLDGASEKFIALDGPGGYVPAESAWRKMDALVSKCQGMNGVGEACLKFSPSLSRMGNTLQQILSAMAGRGSGSGGQGYGMYGESAGLYGPDMTLAGRQAGGGGPRAAPGAREANVSASDARDDPNLPEAAGPGPVKLQRDARFPLRYRDLVGHYFRAVAESQP